MTCLSRYPLGLLGWLVRPRVTVAAVVVLPSRQEAFGFIERGDVVKEIFFHYSEFKGDLETLQAGDDVEFTIKERNVSD